MPIYQKASDEVYELAKSAMARFHSGLRDAGVQVDCVMAFAKTNEQGDKIGPAIEQRVLLLVAPLVPPVAVDTCCVGVGTPYYAGVVSAPQLFAAAIGEPSPPGDQLCFYCGGGCDGAHRAAAFLSDTFTAWNRAIRPESLVLCHGCVCATREAIPLAGYQKLQRVRTFSWVISLRAEGTAGARHFTKAHLPELTAACLTPPAPPFAIVLADSGKKHLIYRTAVNLSRDVVAVQLEEESILVRPAELTERLRLARRIAAAAGKPSLAAPLNAGVCIAISRRDPSGFEPLLAWWDDWQSPISRLAAWLCPNKETCHEHLKISGNAAASSASAAS